MHGKEHVAENGHDDGNIGGRGLDGRGVETVVKYADNTEDGREKER